MKWTILGAGVWLLSASAFAHHSYALFDTDRTMTITGVVKDFQWTNPHAWIELQTTDGSGTLRSLSLQLEAPNVLKRRGWKFNQLNAGDKVTVTFNPSHAQANVAHLLSITLPDGRVLPHETGGNAGPGGNQK